MTILHIEHNSQYETGTLYVVQGSDVSEIIQRMEAGDSGYEAEPEFKEALRTAVLTGETQSWRGGNNRGVVSVTPLEVFGLPT
jgi:hypothetical protein